MSVLTATEDLDQTISSLEIHPNPANDQLFVTIDAIENAEMQINLFDAIGQKVMGEKTINTVIGQNTTPIDVSTLPKGLYHLQLTANGQTGSWKITVQ